MKEQAKRVLRIEADAIAALIDRVDHRFEQAVRLILNCKGRVVVTGMGKSGLIGKKIAATLASTGTPALFLHPAEGIHGDLGMVTRGDTVIALSNSGETEELARMLPSLKRLGIKIIALTGNTESTLAKNSDVVIDVGVQEEACPLGLAPTASTTATLAMGDALAVALLEQRGFKEEDFACFHPGGSLGKRLLLRVQDLMHSGEAIPVVSEQTLIKDAIYEISSKKMGITAVVNAQGSLVGVISDGDLRRWMEKTEKSGENLLTKKAQEIMTRNPKVANKDSLAAEAVALMEKNSITCLIVSSDGTKPEGVIHLHDLLKAGVV
ncbi:MAG: D-arabinose 5-phosphate isomerase [Nitrospirae bacterium GWD2_57_9]|nr:MAG: D-arabinose 5-phosphate isomerase [Nitrospirae bacterium GWD2_57_9]